jgi:hypothetical protein|tara:strand:- start:7117 stop:7890 length:774 start_codon:yes stop_codon:yes gene_type:complete
MAITSSGAIELARDIGVELGQSSTTSCGLEAASRGSIATINTANDVADRPDGSTPHKMSEFYSYDHSASSGVAVGSYGNSILTKLWTGNQGTGKETDSEDISAAKYCGSSVIGQTGHIYYRIKSGTAFRQDAQIYRIDYGTLGVWLNPWLASQVYSTWRTTRITTNAVYNHASTWHTLAAGTVSGRWNRDTGGTPSGGTGIDLSYHCYYEGSGSDAYTKDVYLRSPEITFTTNTIKTESYGYGSNMGTLYMGVYITG